MSEYFWPKLITGCLVGVIIVELVYFFGLTEIISWADFSKISLRRSQLATPIEVEYFPPPPVFRLRAVGDLMLDRGVRRIVERYGDGNYDFVFARIDGLASDVDLLFGNLEGPVAYGGVDGGGLYSFHMSPLVLPALSRAGFGLVSIANNHLADWGRTAFLETMDNLKKNNLKFVGGGLNSSEATSPVIFEKDGLKVGFLAFSDVGPVGLAVGSTTPGVLLVREETFTDIIKRASQLVDVLVVSIHWGDEYQALHNARQEMLAEGALQAGAKVILGHHPHVIQDRYQIGNKYVAYSLGNFVFDQNFSVETMEGLVLDLEIDKNGVRQVKEQRVNLNEAFQPELVE